MLLLAGRERREPDGPTALLLFDVDSSTPLVAMRHQETEDRVVCAVNMMAFGQGHVAFPVIMVDFERGYEETWVFHGSVDEPEELVEPVLRIGNDELPGLGNLLQRSFASATTAAFQVQPLGEMWIVEGGVLARRANRGSAAPGSPQGPQLVGRHLMWMEWEAKVRLAHATFDSPSEIFLDVPDADTLFATDGVDLAWLQGYGWSDVTSTYERVELWAAPHTTNPAELEPRRVLEDHAMGDIRGVVGAHRWVSISGESELEVVDLRDGTRSTVALPSEHVLAAPPSWVSESEIGVAGRYREGGRWVDSFFRLAISE